MVRRGDRVQEAKAWASFWDGEGSAAHVVNSESDAAALRQLWHSFLDAAFSTRARASLVDLACGNAVVCRQAVELAAVRRLDLLPLCQDYSPSALAAGREQMPMLDGCLVASDAGRLPFADQSVDIVASQYGVEYAGESAFLEMARILAGGGCLQAVVHKVDGVIDRQCGEAAELLNVVMETRLVPAFLNLFKLLHKFADSPRTQPSVSAAERRLQSCLETVAGHLQGKAHGAAVTHVSRLRSDIMRVVQNWRGYAVGDIVGWAAGQADAIEGFARRMRSMQSAALDEAKVRTIVSELGNRGLEEVSVDIYAPPHHSGPAGWIIRGRRQKV